MKCNWCGQGKGNTNAKDKKTGKRFFYYCSDCIKDFEKELNPKRTLRKIRITKMELIFCPMDNEIARYGKCLDCKHFNGYYSATGYIECNYDGN